MVKSAVQDLDDARGSSRTLVRFRGGTFQMKHLARWLAALDPSVAQALPQATDEQITTFLKVVVQRQMLLEQADSAGITLSTDDWRQLRAQHDSAISILSAVLNLTPAMLHDSAATPEARRDLAMARVQDYFERLVKGRARFYPVPPFLGETLRAKAEWSVEQSGVQRALERAKELRAATDSAQAPGVPRMTAPPPTGRVDTTPRRRLQ
jgi:hypothetical protein